MEVELHFSKVTICAYVSLCDSREIKDTLHFLLSKWSNVPDLLASWFGVFRRKCVFVFWQTGHDKCAAQIGFEKIDHPRQTRLCTQNTAEPTPTPATAHHPMPLPFCMPVERSACTHVTAAEWASEHARARSECAARSGHVSGMAWLVCPGASLATAHMVMRTRRRNARDKLARANGERRRCEATRVSGPWHVSSIINGTFAGVRSREGGQLRSHVCSQHQRRQVVMFARKIDEMFFGWRGLCWTNGNKRRRCIKANQRHRCRIVVRSMSHYLLLVVSGCK